MDKGKILVRMRAAAARHLNNGMQKATFAASDVKKATFVYLDKEDCLIIYFFPSYAWRVWTPTKRDLFLVFKSLCDLMACGFISFV